MQESEKDHNCRDDEQTISHIEKYGLSVVMIEATRYLPSFAYSIGLWKTFGHPELVSFGLTTKTLHAVINLAADIVKSGQTIQAGKTYSEIFENGIAQFIAVDKRNVSDYFGYAIDFYKTKDINAQGLSTLDKIYNFHPDFTPVTMDDGNYLVEYSQPAFTIVLRMNLKSIGTTLNKIILTAFVRLRS